MQERKKRDFEQIVSNGWYIVRHLHFQCSYFQKKCSDLAFLFGEFLTWWKILKLHLYCINFLCLKDGRAHGPAAAGSGRSLIPWSSKFRLQQSANALMSKHSCY
jgi:hypothetical protein